MTARRLLFPDGRTHKSSRDSEPHLAAEKFGTEPRVSPGLNDSCKVLSNRRHADMDSIGFRTPVHRGAHRRRMNKNTNPSASAFLLTPLGERYAAGRTRASTRIIMGAPATGRSFMARTIAALELQESEAQVVGAGEPVDDI